MNLNFYWCDDVIEQAHNKLMLIGLYADRVVLVPESYIKEQIANADDNNPAALGINKISVLINISDAEGDFHAKGQFYSPNGNTHGPQHDFGTISLIKGRSANIIFQSAPFPFTDFGKYKLIVDIGGNEFETDFSISTH